MDSAHIDRGHEQSGNIADPACPRETSFQCANSAPFRRIAICLIALSIIALVTPSRADERFSLSRHEESLRLVRRFAAARFEDRAAAEEELLDLGLVARKALQDASEDADPEVRTRARRLLGGFQSALVDRAYQRFLADLNGGRDPDLQAWRRYRRVAGDGPEELAFFREMARRFPGAFREMAGWAIHPDDLPEDSLLNGEKFVSTWRHTHQELNTERNASRALIGAQWLWASGSRQETDDCHLDVLLSCQLDYLRQFPDSARTLTEDDPPSRILNRLIRDWIARPGSPYSSAMKVTISRHYGMGDAAARLARQSLSHHVASIGVFDRSSWSRDAARPVFGILATEGAPTDIPLLEKYLESEAIASPLPRSNPGDALMNLEHRDLALIAIIRISRENLKDYGIDPETAPMTSAGWKQYAFRNEEARRRGFTRARERHRELGLSRPPEFKPRPDRHLRLLRSDDLTAGPATDPTGKSGFEFIPSFGHALRDTSTGLFVRSDYSFALRGDNHQFEGAKVHSWAFSRDGRHFAIAFNHVSKNGSRVGGIAVCEATTGRFVHLTPLSAPIGPISALRFSDDGETLLFAADEHKVFVKPKPPSGRGRFGRDPERDGL